MMPMGQYAKCICTKSPFSVAFFRTFMAYSCPLSTPLIFLTRNTCNDNYHKHHILCNCSFVVTFLKQKKKNKLVIYISQHLKMLYSPFVGYQAGASYHHVT